MRNWGIAKQGKKGDYDSFFSEDELNEGMAGLLKSTEFAAHGWHGFRRGGAFRLREEGLGWAELMVHGEWASINEAQHYSSPDKVIVFAQVWELPIPQEGMDWIQGRSSPKSPSELSTPLAVSPKRRQMKWGMGIRKREERQSKGKGRKRETPMWKHDAQGKGSGLLLKQSHCQVGEESRKEGWAARPKVRAVRGRGAKKSKPTSLY